MTLTPVPHSTALLAAGHDGADLFVQLRSGEVYRYSADPIVLVELLSDPSPGRYFNERVRRLPHTRVS